MMFKVVIFAFLTVGALAEYEINEQQRIALKQAVTEYCAKNGAADKAPQVEEAAKNFVDCLKNIFDLNTIKQEIEAAKPNGALDEVFGKYCAKSPQLKTCINTLLSTVSPCLEQGVRDQMSAITNGTDQLIDFVCHKDGDRIALFIAEGGPECFQEKSNEIRECGQKLKDSVPTVDAAKALSLVDQCNKYDELSTCVVRALEGCANPTPGNMAESLFKFIRKGSPCNTAVPKN